MTRSPLVPFQVKSLIDSLKLKHSSAVAPAFSLEAPLAWTWVIVTVGACRSLFRASAGAPEPVLPYWSVK